MLDLTIHDFATIGVLAFLESLLSLDNALVLATIARGVAPELRKKVLLYGLLGAIALRMAAIGLASTLIKYTWLKVVGGTYLLYLVVRYFFFTDAESNRSETKVRNFWKAMVLVELTDLAFAVDSILAAVALTPKFWLIVIGGILGTISIRFATMGLIRVLDHLPRLESSAYLMITVIAVKVILEGLSIPGVDFHSANSAWAWGQWLLMIGCLLYGFKKPSNPSK